MRRTRDGGGNLSVDCDRMSRFLTAAANVRGSRSPALATRPGCEKVEMW